MLRLIHIELIKVFAKQRSYIALLAIFVIIALTFTAVIFEGQNMLDFFIQNLKEAFYMQGNLVNAYMISYIILNFLWIHIPLLIVLVTGDLLAGEAHSGTFRILLTRPVSRTKIVSAKYIAGFVYTLIIILFMFLLSLGGGLLLLGEGDLIVIMGAINIIPVDDILWRFAAAYAYGFLGMATVASLSILLSAMSNNSLGPILMTMAIIIIFTLVTTLNIGIFEVLKPFMLTSYLESWQSFFSFRVDLSGVLIDAGVLLIHILVFYLLTLWVFNKKDILT
ncbi:MAG: ABC transporter permease subunit [Bacteroidota bacterium]|nr:ABC transporter permease subunit [Bacteroidota bacterium]